MHLPLLCSQWLFNTNPLVELKQTKTAAVSRYETNQEYWVVLGRFAQCQT